MLGSFTVLGCGFMCGLVSLCSEYFYKRRGVEAGDRNRVNKIDKQHILKEDISKPRTDKQSRLRSSHTLISAQSSSSLQSLTDDDRHVPTLNLIPATPDYQLRH
ncbi:hypothetical protein Hamer_G019707 [Homarus americanus]|uniref:Uncharacterized protein n=1 Tax=Homarus americanus TaxID=6706 RepID=A0A8J5MZZ8_HOMAM|nr:hypothetical protein Hamer_G019707 [Homarus americanus]